MKILGYIMIALPFVLLATTLAMSVGWLAALSVFGTAALIVGWIVLGVTLVCD